MGTPLTALLNAGGVGRNRDSEPISGFSACYFISILLAILSEIFIKIGYFY